MLQPSELQRNQGLTFLQLRSLIDKKQIHSLTFQLRLSHSRHGAENQRGVVKAEFLYLGHLHYRIRGLHRE
jgi:hypothetical protein